MHAMQVTFRTHRRLTDIVGVAVVAVAAVIVGLVISSAAQPAPPVAPRVNPAPIPPITRAWFGYTLRDNLLVVEALPMTTLQRVFDAADVEAITTARTSAQAQAAALAASRAAESSLDSQVRAFKSSVGAVAPAAARPPMEGRYAGKPLPL